MCSEKAIAEADWVFKVYLSQLSYKYWTSVLLLVGMLNYWQKMTQTPLAQHFKFDERFEQ